MNNYLHPLLKGDYLAQAWAIANDLRIQEPSHLLISRLMRRVYQLMGLWKAARVNAHINRIDEIDAMLFEAEVFIENCKWVQEDCRGNMEAAMALKSIWEAILKDENRRWEDLTTAIIRGHRKNG